jgi:hypothetical protein
MSGVSMSDRAGRHPWLRIELAIRAVLATRLTRGPSRTVDQVLMARVKSDDPPWRGALVVAALAAVLMKSREPELTMLDAWRDTWSGFAIVVGRTDGARCSPTARTPCARGLGKSSRRSGLSFRHGST